MIMRIKGFSLLTLGVILTLVPGCDNVQWAGVDVELRAPDPPPSDPAPEETDPDAEEIALEPLDLGPLLYLVEVDGPTGRILPVAEWGADGYRPLPDEEDTPDFLERFPIDRWEEGTEFILLHQGRRVGTLISDGSTGVDTESCLLRPVTSGSLEVRTDLTAPTRMVAVRRDDVAPGLLPDDLLRSSPASPQLSQPQLRAEAEDLGRHLVPRAEIPWPPSIPDLVADHQQVGVVGEDRMMAATFIFGDEAEVRTAPATAYAFFTLAREEEGEWSPFWLWFQEVSQGKAIPRVLASGRWTEADAPELVLELFGSQERGLAILGAREGEWSLLYRDPCGPEPADGAARSWPW